jgi:UDP-3-O-[3-hydroxymyristoyl] glucosamine N-acyltransferase
LSLCADRRRLEALQATRAAGVLLPAKADDLAEAAPCAVLLVDDVRLALAAALELFHPAQPPAPGVQAGALVDPQAQVDPSARIEPGAQVGPGARVGARTRVARGAIVEGPAEVGQDCLLGTGAIVLGCVRIGDRVRVGPGCVLGADGFGFAAERAGLHRIPQIGRVEIGDDVELGANCSVDRGTLGATVIGAGTKLDNLVQVGHNVVIGRSVCIAAQTGLSGSVTIEDGAVLGGQVGVADHLTIGAGAQVGSKSGVGGHVPAGARVAGYPAVDVKQWLRHVFGLRRLQRAIKRLEARDE